MIAVQAMHDEQRYDCVLPKRERSHCDTSSRPLLQVTHDEVRAIRRRGVIYLRERKVEFSNVPVKSVLWQV